MLNSAAQTLLNKEHFGHFVKETIVSNLSYLSNMVLKSNVESNLGSNLPLQETDACTLTTKPWSNASGCRLFQIERRTRGVVRSGCLRFQDMCLKEEEEMFSDQEGVGSSRGEFL